MNPSDDDFYDAEDHAAFLAEQEAFEADYGPCFSPDVSSRDIAFEVWKRARESSRAPYVAKPRTESDIRLPRLPQSGWATEHAVCYTGHDMRQYALAHEASIRDRLCDTYKKRFLRLVDSFGREVPWDASAS